MLRDMADFVWLLSIFQPCESYMYDYIVYTYVFILGMLNYKPVRFRKSLLPPLREFLDGECRNNSENLHCFQAGDLRVNEQPGEIFFESFLGWVWFSGELL